RGASPLALVGAGVFALGLGVLGFVLGRAGRTPEHAPLAAARVSANAPVAGAPTPSAAPPVPTTLLERAAAGDNEALGDLEARAPTERSTDEALALAAGRATERLGDLAALGKTIRDEPEKLADRATRQKLIAAARDGASYREAQRIFASLPGSEGADLLYEVWTGTRQRTPATELAESLVWSKEVRGRASPALALALELRAPTSCEDAQKLLAKALELGDRRAVPLLVRLTVKRGCGESKREDCYPCLRADKNAVADAVKAARGRPPPF
ncbi:MAG: hypothetical protein OZ928_14650, partial [Polyangiaceae bacterium]|nr:hypothetical protein [Polyangiaceae bacterium]